jgi:hypothetical protein
MHCAVVADPVGANRRLGSADQHNMQVVVQLPLSCAGQAACARVAYKQLKCNPSYATTAQHAKLYTVPLHDATQAATLSRSRMQIRTDSFQRRPSTMQSHSYQCASKDGPSLDAGSLPHGCSQVSSHQSHDQHHGCQGPLHHACGSETTCCTSSWLGGRGRRSASGRCWAVTWRCWAVTWRCRAGTGWWGGCTRLIPSRWCSGASCLTLLALALEPLPPCWSIGTCTAPASMHQWCICCKSQKAPAAELSVTWWGYSFFGLQKTSAISACCTTNGRCSSASCAAIQEPG